jgi:nucleotide-binding universal stress UspA family protein
VHALYATDGREPAVWAGRLLVRLAEPRLAEVTALHVDEYGNPVVADRFAEAALGPAVESLTRAGLKAGRKRVRGNVKQAIQEELATDIYDLAAMGVGNEGWLGRLILGGVSTSVLYQSSIPTLVVARAPAGTHDRIKVVVGADGSPAAAQGMDALLGLTAPDRCEVFIRAVVDMPFGWPDVEAAAAAELEEFAETAAEASERHLQEAMSRFDAEGFAPMGDVVHGSASFRLTEAIEQRDADLIVVGSRGLGRVASAVLGSVSAHLVRTAPATLVGKHA